MLTATRPVLEWAYIRAGEPSKHAAAPRRVLKWLPAQSGASEEITMNRMKSLAGLCLLAFLAAVPAFAQSDAKQKEPQKPALTGSAAILEQWNDIGRKLIDMAQDLPQDRYDYKPNPASRSFVEQLLHVSASMYFFTDLAEGKKARYGDDPKRDELKTKEQVVAFVKKAV
jgi:hypothetical protein